MKSSFWLKFLLALVLCQSAGAIGSLFTLPAISDWYTYLRKPSFTPPSWVFGPAWAILYTLMAIAASLVWEKGLKTPGVREALVIFLVQLVLNSVWSLLFFGLRSPLYGFLEILVLWAAILTTILRFLKVSRLAASLLVPYLLWVSFASSLNLGILLLNL